MFCFHVIVFRVGILEKALDPADRKISKPGPAVCDQVEHPRHFLFASLRPVCFELFDENVLHAFFRADDAVVAERSDDYDCERFNPADGEGIHQHPRLSFRVACDYVER